MGGSSANKNEPFFIFEFSFYTEKNSLFMKDLKQEIELYWINSEIDLFKSKANKF